MEEELIGTETTDPTGTETTGTGTSEPVNLGFPGIGQIDTLTGNAEGRNLYLLGLPTDNGPVVFYNDGDPNTAGITDYALITNFVFAEDPNTQDRIVLTGDLSSYSIGASPEGLPSGAGIFYTLNQAAPELIAIVGNVSDPSQLNINDPNQFGFVNFV
ncbi:hypothetical protein [Iningainema tapete]|uniref:Uncharacterized protein n=1 Tax=Iningainema tapete BLCC-T55 TaxID=2748662 RepID=A0A8J6XLE4_9CYAN|nr:hypothetical protein [Iningainema tapete]MBD2774565.1 hypothetical protein [Iningainema tapete BLCC-T55]